MQKQNALRVAAIVSASVLIAGIAAAAAVTTTKNDGSNAESMNTNYGQDPIRSLAVGEIPDARIIIGGNEDVDVGEIPDARVFIGGNDE
jgi:hypothetical protein